MKAQNFSSCTSKYFMYCYLWCQVSCCVTAFIKDFFLIQLSQFIIIQISVVQLITIYQHSQIEIMSNPSSEAKQVEKNSSSLQHDHIQSSEYQSQERPLPEKIVEQQQQYQYQHPEQSEQPEHAEQPEYFYDQESCVWYDRQGRIVEFQNYAQEEHQYIQDQYNYAEKNEQQNEEMDQSVEQNIQGVYQQADRHEGSQQFKIKESSNKKKKSNTNISQEILLNNANEANYYRKHIYANQDNGQKYQNWRSEEIYSQNENKQIQIEQKIRFQTYNQVEEKKQENGDRVPVFLPRGKHSEQQRQKSEGDNQHILQQNQLQLIPEQRNILIIEEIIQQTKEETVREQENVQKNDEIKNELEKKVMIPNEQEVQKKEKKKKKHKKQKQNNDEKKKEKEKDKKEIIVKQQNEGKPLEPPSPPSQIKLSQSEILSVAVEPSLIEQGIKSTIIIKQAEKQRIETTLKLFVEYTTKHRLAIINQQSAYLNVYEQLDRRKTSKYVWYHIIKQYLEQYQKLARNFHEASYRVNKNEEVTNKNIHLNIAEQLKQGFDQLVFLKKETGNVYHRLNDFTNNKVYLELEVAFNKFISQVNRSQQQVQEKKKLHFQLEEQFKKRIQKLTKIYSKGKEGRKQDEDVFVQTCQFIQLQKSYRNSLLEWGRSIIQIRKSFINLQQRLNDQLQGVLNTFKNTLGSVYSFHAEKFQKVISSKDQVLRQTKYVKLCTLSDTDYIKYSMEMIKNPISQIKDKNFEDFVDMPHFQLIVGKSTLLLKGMVNKSFQLKEKNQELINTISGNLVQFNKQYSTYKDKFIIKNLEANIVADGVIQFDQVIPGIIFDDRRSIRLVFRDQDRAEELICMLNEKI